MVLVVDLCRLLAQRSASSTPSRDTIDVGKMNNCRPSQRAAEIVYPCGSCPGQQIAKAIEYHYLKLPFNHCLLLFHTNFVSRLAG